MQEIDIDEVKKNALGPRRNASDISDSTEKSIGKVIENVDMNSKDGKKILYARITREQKHMFPLFFAMNKTVYKSKFLEEYLVNELYATWGINGEGTQNQIKIALALISKDREDQSKKRGILGYLKSKIGKDNKNGFNNEQY